MYNQSQLGNYKRFVKYECRHSHVLLVHNKERSGNVKSCLLVSEFDKWGAVNPKVFFILCAHGEVYIF